MVDRPIKARALSLTCALLFVASAFAASSSDIVARPPREIGVNVLDTGARCIGAGYDDTAGIQAAIDKAGGGGRVIVPPLASGGYCNVTAPLLIEDKRALHLDCAPGQPGWSGPRIVANHTGKAIVSLIGSFLVRIDNCTFESVSGGRPKTGILLGRSSSASAGSHSFNHVRINGYFQVAGVYNVASEQNVWINSHIQTTAAPFTAWYESQTDNAGAGGVGGQAIGGLTGSSMEQTTIIGGTIGNWDTTAGSSAMFLDVGSTTGHTLLSNVFFYKQGGEAYLKIRNGSTNGLGARWPITILGFGETSNAPAYGVRIISNGGESILTGLSIDGYWGGVAKTYSVEKVVLSAAWLRSPMITETRSATFHSVQYSELMLMNESALTFGKLAGTTVRARVTPTVIADSGGNRMVTPAAGAGRASQFLQLNEIAAPSLPLANEARVYTEDDGGKTKLCVRFTSGAHRCFATEP